MQIHLAATHTIHEIGKRKGNEDSLFPRKPTTTDRLFIVCDGVGGNPGGAVASEITCNTIPTYFKQYVNDISSETHLQEAVALAQKSLRNFIKNTPEYRAAATTLALLHFNSKGATVAHIGDSRVYQFRKGAILHKTSDHSFVNELVELGILEPEQAVNHPQKNIITRCITATKDVAATVTYLTDIQPEDVFFLCSDGIIEGCDDQKIAAFFQHNSPEIAMDLIAEECLIFARDNYTAICVVVN
jgi:PPM family protein phosphatase